MKVGGADCNGSGGGGGGGGGGDYAPRNKRQGDSC